MSLAAQEHCSSFDWALLENSITMQVDIGYMCLLAAIYAISPNHRSFLNNFVEFLYGSQSMSLHLV